MKIGLVIPTIFSRPNLIPLSVKSAEESGADFLLIAGPAEHGLISDYSARAFPSKYLPDKLGHSLPIKINRAFSELPAEIEYIAWLGDDDLLNPGMLLILAEALEAHPKASLAFGDCEYIDKSGRSIILNRFGKFASLVLPFGPQLIPQPSTLFRRSSFERAGGLTNEFELAFDFDLFMRMKNVGPFVYVPKTISKFRWHEDSLSVKRRTQSVNEASKVRISHYPTWFQTVSGPWECLVKYATLRAGELMHFKATRAAHKSSEQPTLQGLD